MQERQNLEQQFISYENLNRSYTESMEIYHLALDEGDRDLLDESQKNILHLQKKSNQNILRRYSPAKLTLMILILKYMLRLGVPKSRIGLACY